MGTASSYGGSAPGNPLIPSWLGDANAPPADQDAAAADPVAAPAGDAAEAPAEAPAGTIPAVAPAAVAGITADFGAARGNFSRFAKSGGHDRRALGRAISSYVRAGGGGARAAHRMGASPTAGAALVGFLADAANRGVAEALRTLNLPGLAGRPAAEIFGALIDVFCPEGGTIDEAVARDAFVEMIIDLAEIGIEAITDLGPDRMPQVFELFAAHAIEARLENDIALKAVSVPANTAAAQRVQDVLREFVRRAVHDIVARADDLRTLTQERISGWVDVVYAQAFELLRVFGEAEAR
jgi:hypothetical protein